MAAGRWWEFYFVRYAMGTLVGGLVVSLLMHSDKSLCLVLTRPLDGVTGSARLVVLGIFGLVFCYIASVPILVFHASRSLLPVNRPKETKGRIYKFLQEAAPALLTGGIYLFIVLYVTFALMLLRSPDLDLKIAKIGFYAFLVATCLPAALSVLTLIYRRRSYEFYKSLAKARSRQGDAGELVTSYRHLREHGNSLFIVLLEGILGLMLLCAHRSITGFDKVHVGLVYPPQFYLYAVIVFMWVMPGVAIWFLATLIENEFIRDPFWP
jgi:hypothetical protein